MQLIRTNEKTACLLLNVVMFFAVCVFAAYCIHMYIEIPTVYYSMSEQRCVSVRVLGETHPCSYLKPDQNFHVEYVY